LGIDASGNVFLLDCDVHNLKVGLRRRGRKNKRRKMKKDE